MSVNISLRSLLFIGMSHVSFAIFVSPSDFKSYWILMIGRLLGGVATSLLFSIFDSWLIKAHSMEGIDKVRFCSIFLNSLYFFSHYLMFSFFQ